MDEPGDATRVELRGEQQTMLMTLHLHAEDARSGRPVLADDVAVSLLDRIDYDPVAMRRLRGNGPLIVGRAKLIDDRVRRVLARDEHAVVLHLGCGLDSRVLRIDPPPTVTWIEVDQGPVIELRRRLYPERSGVVTITASVSQPEWWTAVPSDRPLLVVAEGLFMYLSPDDVQATCDAIVGHDASSTTLIADTVAPWVRRVAGWQPTMRRAGTGFASTTNDLTRAMAPHQRFTSAAAESLVATAAQAATGPLERIIKLIDGIGPGHRAMTLNEYRTQDA